jgi:hypothetical protein
LPGSFNFRPAIACRFEMDRRCLAADFARQLPDNVCVVAVEAVCDTEDCGEPLDKLTPFRIKGGEFPMPGGIRQCLRMVSGNKGTRQSVPFVQARDREFEDQVAAQLVVFP